MCRNRHSFRLMKIRLYCRHCKRPQMFWTIQILSVSTLSLNKFNVYMYRQVLHYVIKVKIVKKYVYIKTTKPIYLHKLCICRNDMEKQTFVSQIGVLESFAWFTGKHLCQGLISINLTKKDQKKTIKTKKYVMRDHIRHELAKRSVMIFKSTI